MFKKFIILSLLVPTLAFAWEPTKPITVIIGNQPGSGNELVFRKLTAAVAKKNPKVNFVIELKPGADGVVAMNKMYESAPDGYTIAIPGHMGTYITNDIWQKPLKKWQYNSFTSVMGLGESPLVFVANPSSKVNNVSELIRLVQTTNKPITFATGGGSHILAFEYFMNKSIGDRKLVKNTNYQGPLQAVTAVAGDNVTEFGIMPLFIAMPLIQAGKVKVIGITGDKRLKHYPSAEPIVVGGHHIQTMASWAIILPPNTPKEIVDWYLKVFVPALKDPEVKQYYEDNLITVVPDQLSTKGHDKYIENLRNTFMPLSKDIIVTQ